MNIKNRIKKIELETKAFSGFCECRETPKFEIVYHEDGKPATSPNLETREPLPDFCATCGRAVSKTALIIDFVSSQILNPEGEADGN